MKAALVRFGIRGFKPALRKAAERLDGVRTAEGNPLPANTRAELRRDMARLRVVVDQIKEIEDDRVRELEATSELEPGPPAMVRLIARIVGIGVETADMLVREVLSRDLRDRQAIARYAGLTGPLVFFDALRVKVRDEGIVRNKAVHIALGVRADGAKEILGLWLEQNEGAKFWLRVMNELRNRGVDDILLAVVDGLKGFPDAILAVFPEATIQTCIVHLLRHSLDFVSYKDRKPVAAALKGIYRALDAAAAETALAAFEEGLWGRKYPAIGQSWRRAWNEVVPFYAFHADVRRILYTTNAIEALNAKLRRAVRARGHFPTDDAAMKLLFLVLNRSEKEWKMAPREWSMAKAQFAVIFGERFTRAMAA